MELNWTRRLVQGSTRASALRSPESRTSISTSVAGRGRGHGDGSMIVLRTTAVLDRMSVPDRPPLSESPREGRCHGR